MKIKYSLIFVISALSFALISSQVSGGRSKEKMTYTGCRQKVLQNFNSKQINQKVLSEQLAVCSEKFPAASLYKDCKTNAFLKFRSNQTLAGNAMKYCNLILQAATYDENAALPVRPIAGQFFYVGTGINKTLPAANHDLPNFDCSRIQEDILDIANAEYVLFGNEPRLFKNFATLPTKDYTAKFAVTTKPKNSDRFRDLKGLGRLFPGKRKAGSLLFFPSSYCLFSGPLGKYFQDHKIFYLLDAEEKKLTPYFGMSFFKPKLKIITSAEFAKQLAKRLGPKYVTQEKQQRIWIIAEKPSKEFDDEGDPKNVCREPLANNFVGVVKNSSENKNYPESFLVANIKNLCEFGEHLSQKWKIR